MLLAFIQINRENTTETEPTGGVATIPAVAPEDEVGAPPSDSEIDIEVDLDSLLSEEELVEASL